MSALPRILNTDDLPAAELCAARLDGELVPIAGAWAPLDVVETRVDRAVAAGSGLPRRWIAELGTAAWIWGAREDPPLPLTFCARLAERGPRSRRGVALREVVIVRAELARLGGVLVTTPQRTILDLARTGPWEPEVARRLAAGAGIGAAELRALATIARSAPHGRLAAKRIDELSPR